jgi:hypothetical protein
MQFYQFEVLKGEAVISSEPSVPLYNTRACLAQNWEAGEEHQSARMPHPSAGAVWRNDHSGGVAVAMRYADFNFGA